jgi:peptide/nickel transport system substrate-binding protein
VWDIDRKLQQDMARPILYHYSAATCWAPAVKGYTPMVNSVYNNPRFESVWLDR